LPGEVVDGGGVGAAGGGQAPVFAGRAGEDGQAGAQELVVQPGEERACVIPVSVTW
jgi:hypothetical protein